VRLSYTDTSLHRQKRVFQHPSFATGGEQDGTLLRFFAVLGHNLLDGLYQHQPTKSVTMLLFCVDIMLEVARARAFYNDSARASEERAREREREIPGPLVIEYHF